MNSIKNAIVTVTLLAVGYGSVIVLSEPESGPYSASSQMADANPVTEHVTPELPNIQIEQAVAPADKLAKSVPSANIQPPLALPDFASSGPAKTPTPPAFAAQGHGTQATPIEGLAKPGVIAGPEFNLEAPKVTVAPPPKQGGFPDFPELPPLPELGSPEQVQVAVEPPPSAGVAVTPPTGQPGALDFGQTNLPSTQPELPSFTPAPASKGVVELQSEGIGGPAAVLPPEANSDTGGSANTGGDALKQFDAQLATPGNGKGPSQLSPIDSSLGPIPPGPNEGSPGFEIAWNEIQETLRSKDVVAALRKLTPWATDSTLSAEQSQRCYRLLDELAGTVVYSRTSYLEPAYIVRAGETLEEIAAAHRVPQELLAKINGVQAPYALSTGEQLKVLRGPFRAEIGIASKQLTLFVGPHYAGRFNVEIGRDLPPEEAFYDVGEKSLGRSYFDRRVGNEVLRGEQSNRYGGYWIGFRGEHITTGHSVGIHSRAKQGNPDEIGCISLDVIDAGDVFSILSIGSRVQVRR